MGFTGDEDEWLANFTDNPIEWFSQYHVRFLPAHVRHLREKAKALAEEIKVLKKDTSGKPDKKIEEKQQQLDAVRKDAERFSRENFEKLSPRERSIHEKAFLESLAVQSVYTEFWMYMDILRQEVFHTLRNPDITNKTEVISQDIDDFKTVLLAWVERAMASGIFDEKGLQQLEAAKTEYEQKQTPPKDPPQDPPSEPDPLKESADAIKALLDELKPGDHLSKDGAATPETDPEVIQSVKDTLELLRSEQT